MAHSTARLTARLTAMATTSARQSSAKTRTKTSSPEATIWTIKVTRHPWEATLEIDSGAYLGQLHLAIQKAVEFDNDHLYCFYVARTVHGRHEVEYEGDARLADLYPLPAKRKLFYLFDFGDSWKFSVTRTRTAPKRPAPGVTYPRVIANEGEKPEQYSRSDW